MAPNAPKFDQFQWLKNMTASDMDRTAKLVCVVIFNYSNGTGINAYPGPSLIARELGIDVRTVTRATKRLRDAGWITLVSRGGVIDGKNMANKWRLSYPSKSESTGTPGPRGTGDRGGAGALPPGGAGDRGVGALVPHQQPIEQPNKQPTAHAPTLTIVNGGFGSAVEPEKSLRKESSPKPGDIDPWSGAPIPDPSQCHDHRPAGGFGCPNCTAA